MTRAKHEDVFLWIIVVSMFLAVALLSYEYGRYTERDAWCESTCDYGNNVVDAVVHGTECYCRQRDGTLTPVGPAR